MSFSKYRIAVPAAIVACLLVASSAWAQGVTIFRGNSGSGDVFLGISMEDVTASNMSEYRLSNEKGAIVRSVQEESPAEEAGLRENDVILEFAGQTVLSTRQLSRLVTETPAGRSVAITVSRDGKLLNLSATIRTRPDSGSGNRIDQRFLESFPGGQLERFFESFPGEQARPGRPARPDVPNPQRPEGGRQGTERSEQRPRLGVETQPLTEQMAEYMGVPGKRGVLIVSVLGGSASEGKLRAGDVVIGVNDREIASPADLTNSIQQAASGEITIRIIRDKKQISVTVSLPSNNNNEEEERSGGYRL